jgi:hypothetical protein
LITVEEQEMKTLLTCVATLALGLAVSSDASAQLLRARAAAALNSGWYPGYYSSGYYYPGVYSSGYYSVPYYSSGYYDSSWYMPTYYGSSYYYPSYYYGTGYSYPSYYYNSGYYYPGSYYYGGWYPGSAVIDRVAPRVGLGIRRWW